MGLGEGVLKPVLLLFSGKRKTPTRVVNVSSAEIEMLSCLIAFVNSADPNQPTHSCISFRCLLTEW